MEKKKVYNGYKEKYLNGIELKQMYKDEFLGVRRHHASVAGIRINEYLTLIGIEDEIIYRIFYNDYFCRIMDGENDKLINFFSHVKPSDFVTKFDLNDYHYDISCPKCGSEVECKEGKYGLFIGCKAYPDCKYTLKIPMVGYLNLNRIDHRYFEPLQDDK